MDNGGVKSLPQLPQLLGPEGMVAISYGSGCLVVWWWIPDKPSVQLFVVLDGRNQLGFRLLGCLVVDPRQTVSTAVCCTGWSQSVRVQVAWLFGGGSQINRQYSCLLYWMAAIS